MSAKHLLKPMFDPELPLFKTKVKGHQIEFYFIGHKSKDANMWLVTIDAEGTEYHDLPTAMRRTAQICKTRYDHDIKFTFPEDS